MNLPKDLREFIELLNALEARYLVVGAYAVAYHGYPRYTRDIDLFVDSSEENAKRIVAAIERFGFGDQWFFTGRSGNTAWYRTKPHRHFNVPVRCEF